VYSEHKDARLIDLSGHCSGSR